VVQVRGLRAGEFIRCEFVDCTFETKLEALEGDDRTSPEAIKGAFSITYGADSITYLGCRLVAAPPDDYDDE
jgi:hypothetical protein